MSASGFPATSISSDLMKFSAGSKMLTWMSRSGGEPRKSTYATAMFPFGQDRDRGRELEAEGRS